MGLQVTFICILVLFKFSNDRLTFQIYLKKKVKINLIRNKMEKSVYQILRLLI